ncbi:inorganic phosphate transporter [Pararhizobium antarcticum]|uniref:Phosphate transporter n=1 Tax=Pararhizobium antarcticum TaxID=1798805 RepID=A0A657LYV7_9HYPH|nr:inorganic phosphate transporter [Pararhizobium antarcticum]OJF90351.1 inorganic phosphate transporter [Rhizobium sp. 58]OJG00587.1 inorganic phosphate transporter [Pararhizobium antarcticum]
MGKPLPSLEKPTLDKDLDKVTFAEEASHHVLKPWAGLGLGLIFVLSSMLFAAAYISEQPAFLMIIAAAALAGYMAMNIGANDVTNNVGAAVGSKAITMTTALVIAAIFEIAGAVFAGGRVVSTIGGGIINTAVMPTGEVYAWVMMAALLSAAVWINIATWSGAPISTTHSIIGGILGAGIAAAGVSAVHWWSLAGIAASWMVSPLLGGGIAAALLAFIKIFITYRDDRITRAVFWMPILIAAMTGAFTAYFSVIGLENVIHLNLSTGIYIGLAVALATLLITRPWIRRQAKGLEDRNQSLRKLFKAPLILSAALLSFAHGANDVSNVVGPLSAIVASVNGLAVSDTTAVPLWEILIGALGISCGILLFGPKLIRVVGQEITKLNPMRAFCVALATATTVLIATALGLPVSTTHTAVGAVFGIGFFREWFTRNSKLRLEYVRRKTGQTDFQRLIEESPDERHRRQLVRRSHFMTIIAAWVITVPASALLSAGVYVLFAAIFI